MKKVDPKTFDPNVLAESLQEEVNRQSQLTGFSPTSILVKVEYFMPDAPALICPNKFIWQFDDFAPMYLRLCGFLGFWKEKIEGEIKEVEVWDTQCKASVIWTSESDWPTNGGSLTFH